MQAIDALTPMARGQDILLTGPPGSGKTTTALDAVLGQQRSDVTCVYAATSRRQGARCHGWDCYGQRAHVPDRRFAGMQMVAQQHVPIWHSMAAQLMPLCWMLRGHLLQPALPPAALQCQWQSRFGRGADTRC